MCVIGIAYRASELFPLIVAANRDERHDRPTSAAAWWLDRPGILSGRDLVAGGTWLAVGTNGRFAAVTNVVDPAAPAAALSRGALVGNFMVAALPAAHYAAAIDPGSYGPFNLLLLDGTGLWYVSNRQQGGRLGAGIHAFSNNTPGEDWPKVHALGSAIRSATEADGAAAVPATQAGHDALLRHRGRSGRPGDPVASRLLDILGGPEARGTRATAPESLFIVGDTFGTRCSTALVVDAHGRGLLRERRFAADGRTTGESSFEFDAPELAGR